MPRAAPFSTSADAATDHVEAVRRFNRFNTRLVGALNEHLLASNYTLPQVRVLYEIATGTDVSAADLARTLRLDRGYLSRLLAGLEKDGLVARSAAEGNAKRLVLSLTPRGAKTFAELNRASADEVAGLLARVEADRRAELVAAMERIEMILGDEQPAQRGDEAVAPPAAEPYRLRDPMPGDMGFVTHRQGVLYWQEYGWDWRFEGLVAEIVGQFVREFDPERERCWIAERDGPNGPEVIGSVFLVRESEAVAKLRLLYVDPAARGLGLGRRLVAECIAFARARGYRTLTLWTNDVLVAARHIYEAEGFILAEEAPHHSFGKDLVGQNWTLAL